MLKIDSKNNNKIKDLIKLRDESKFRNDKSLFYVEGERILKDTPHELINALYIKKSYIDNFKSIYKNLSDDIIYVVDDDLFDKIKDTKNSQGIIGIIKYNNIDKLTDELLKNINSCLILDNINDPGNLGTIIRLAEATNISLVILCNNCCNLYNTKVIRSCMSSIFRVKIYISTEINKDINRIINNGFEIYSSVLSSDAKQFYKINYKQKSAFILGNEANGISEELINISNDKIFIPMFGNIQSLNVAVAATAICYEYMRQMNYYET